MVCLLTAKSPTIHVQPSKGSNTTVALMRLLHIYDIFTKLYK